MRRFLSLLALMIALTPTASATGDVKILDFSATDTNGTVPLHVYFTGNVTGNVTNWHWKFQNEGTGNITYSNANVTAVHIFGKPGIYDVTLDVRVPGGNDTLIKPAYISVNTPGSNMSIADFTPILQVVMPLLTCSLQTYRIMQPDGTGTSEMELIQPSRVRCILTLQRETILLI